MRIFRIQIDSFVKWGMYKHCNSIVCISVACVLSHGIHFPKFIECMRMCHALVHYRIFSCSSLFAPHLYSFQFSFVISCAVARSVKMFEPTTANAVISWNGKRVEVRKILKINHLICNKKFVIFLSKSMNSHFKICCAKPLGSLTCDTLRYAIHVWTTNCSWMSLKSAHFHWWNRTKHLKPNISSVCQNPMEQHCCFNHCRFLLRYMYQS